MGTLYLVRHGQASFGADDYDQLSELGTRQCHALGQWFATRGLQFDAVLRGTLKRHAQSLAAIQKGLAESSVSAPEALSEALLWPGLNEYDSAALISAVHPGPLAKPDSPEVYRAHFRLLREALSKWMEGSTQPVGMPSWEGFVAGVTTALDHVRQNHSGNVLVVSSGGPISTAVAHILGAPASTMIELNMRTRNSSLTEFAFTPKRHLLQAFNQLPHLDHADRRSWETYA